MKNLFIDIETYSSVDIGKAGSYRYAQSDDFEVLLFAYKIDDEPTLCVDLINGETIPSGVKAALVDPVVVKHAYNAAFEWYCLNRAGFNTPIDQWKCTMVHAMYEGFPAGLKATGDAVGLPEDKKKLSTGQALIRYFCSPCKPTKSNGGRTRNLPIHDKEKWDLFKGYNIQDVEAEYAIEQKLKGFDLPEEEWTRWRKDTLMNALGVRLDCELIDGAIQLSQQASEELLSKARKITGLDNPKSNVQFLSWVQSRGVETENLQKKTVEQLLKTNIPDDVREALLLRKQFSRTSVTKYEAMQRCIGEGDRARGLLQYYGANRTGRYAGRLVQVQNLRRNSLSTLDEARRLVKSGNYEGVKMIYGDVPDTLSQLIRTAFIPSDGHKFIVSDFSAIEARIVAWLAGEDWVLQSFRDGKDIYCETASQMFGVPVVKHGINGELRQKGKIATLACGYNGGVGAMKAMGALEMGLKEEELQTIVDNWRKANPNIVRMWGDYERAARNAIETGEAQKSHHTVFRLEKYGDLYFMTIELPSGRKLFYSAPRIDYSMDPHGRIAFLGQNQTTKKWELIETFGGKLAENITQAVARDCLVVTMNRVEEAGFIPVMHVHDEIIIDAIPSQKLEDVNDIFAEPIPWAPGLPLKGDGYECKYYKKD